VLLDAQRKRWGEPSKSLAARDRSRECDSELRLLAAVRWSIREHGGEPSSHLVDELLDERLEISASSVR
jgi:hypothetical protein